MDPFRYWIAALFLAIGTGDIVLFFLFMYVRNDLGMLRAACMALVYFYVLQMLYLEELKKVLNDIYNKLKKGK